MRKVFLICAVLISFIFISCSSDSSSPTEPGNGTGGGYTGNHANDATFYKQYPVLFSYSLDVCEALNIESGYIIVNNFLTNFILQKTDKYGEIEWQKVFEYSNQDIKIFRSEKMECYIVVGIVEEHSDNKYFSLTYIDSEGNVVNRKEYPIDENIYYDKIDILHTNDGGILIYTKRSYELEDSYLCKIDEYGNKEWSLHIEYLIESVSQTSDDSFFIISRTSLNDSKLIKINKIGDIDWVKLHTNYIFNNIISKKNNESVIFGHQYNNGIYKNIMINIDNNGVTNWEKEDIASGYYQRILAVENENYFGVTSYGTYVNDYKYIAIYSVNKDGMWDFYKEIETEEDAKIYSLKRAYNGYIISGNFLESNKIFILRVDNNGNYE